ncbi:Tannase/feruloyl esterase [Paraphoma chrysanthemicola]|nr:Tannase/feruloyl esterase [Paraphoma chrysanthemicola]
MAANNFYSSLFLNSQQWLARYNDSLCSSNAFSGITLPNIDVVSITAVPFKNYTYQYPAYVPPTPDISSLNFCNVTITYNHPGYNDTINTSVYLPTKDWNGRYQAAGGSGFSTGGTGTLFITALDGLSKGFVVSTTDGGHSSSLAVQSGADNAWALTSPGNANWNLVADFSYIALHEMVSLSKNFTEIFYGQAPSFSYYYGGSQGGRQGYQYAQRFPYDFDGIVALFPAIEWSKLMALLAWPSIVMELNKVYPPSCETGAITTAVIEACDSLDGVVDGIISRPDLCTFNAYSVIGKTISCEGTQSSISKAAALVMSEAWNGPRYSNGKTFFHGFVKGTDISSPGNPAATTCTTNNSTGEQTCAFSGTPLGPGWFGSFVLKDLNATFKNITFDQWDELNRLSRQEYDSLLETADPDLSLFKEAGGKLLTWHGLADPLISANNTEVYHDQVKQLDPKLDDFYRLFLMAGGVHSTIGPIQVKNIQNYIVNWVEKGNAPETILATGTDPTGKPYNRNLCKFPRVQHYIGGNSSIPEAYKCV